MKTESLSRMVLPNLMSMPVLLDATAVTADGVPRSWVQMAKTGDFESSRYGKFSITTDDLATMVKNFRTITPVPPTQLVIDFDHLSEDPKQPGDGQAAGWVETVELRAGGTQLWGRIAWTPTAANLIRTGGYKFFSPSFARNYKHIDGREIGTTLLAGGITNHPFLQGMSQVTLHSREVMGDLALDAKAAAPATARLDLADIGQRVGFDPNPEKTPELTDEERGQTLLVEAQVGDGSDQFVRLVTTDGGVPFGWYRADQLGPAPAADAPSPLPTNPPPQTEVQMTSDVISAAKFAEAVKQFELSGKSTAAAMRLAATADEAGAQAYRLAGIQREMAPEAPGPVLALSVTPGADETFESVVARYVAEHPGVSLKQAIRTCADAHPSLALSR